MAERVVIHNKLSPGDIVVLTAAIRDISLAYPGRFDFMLKTSTPAVWANNPYIRAFPEAGAKSIVANYPLIKQCNQNRLHFVWGFLDDLNKKLGVNAPLTELRPDLHISAAERLAPPITVEKPYWVMVSGGKSDFTAKWWHPASWQTVVDNVSKSRTIVQVGGHTHAHPRLKGVVDLVGKTSMRDLINLIYHAEGVMCIVTCLSHIAAAFNRPTVIIAGGREPYWWEAYTNETRTLSMRRSAPNWTPPADNYLNQVYLHTMNQLPCCMNKGCWRTHVGNRPRRCEHQVKVAGIDQPKCMTLIKPEHVSEAVQSYFKVPLLKATPALPDLTPPSVYITGSTPVLGPSPVKAPIFAGRQTFRPPVVQATINRVMPGKIECLCAPVNAAKWVADGMPMTTGTPAERRQSGLMSQAEWLFWVSPNVIPGSKKWINQLRSELTADALGFVGWKPFEPLYESLSVASWYAHNTWDISSMGPRVHTMIGNSFVVKTRVFKDVFAQLVPVTDDVAAVAVSEYCRRKGLRRRNAGTWLSPI